MKLINPHYKFSFYNNLYSAKAPDGELDMNQLIEIIRYGYIKSIIEELRNTDDKKRFEEIKLGSIQCVTLSGIFKARNKESLLKHSGLMQVDLDDVNNYEDLFNKLINDPFTYVCFKSPGGKGIKIIVKILLQANTHLEQFNAIERYFKDEYGIIIDSSCSDIARCLLLSYDPNLYCNPFSTVFEECFNPNPKPQKEALISDKVVSIETHHDSSDLIKRIIEEVSKLGIDITETYDNWIRLGFGLSAEFGEGGRAYFHQLSQFHDDYNYEKCDAQYTKLSKSNSGAIKFGTVVHLAKSKGIEIKQVKKLPPINYQKAISIEKSLRELLFRKRQEIALREGKSIYSIFQDRSLAEMESYLPVDEESFRSIIGVTWRKKKDYANDFLPLIKDYLKQEGKSEKLNEISKYNNSTAPLSKEEEGMYEELDQLRSRISKESQIDSKFIFLSYSMKEIARFKPINKEQLLAINGIEEKHYNWFGSRILEIVAKYV